MATFGECWRPIRDYAPAPATMCRRWIKDRYAELIDRRMWSFQWGHGCWVIHAPINSLGSWIYGSNQVSFPPGVLPGDNSIVGWQLMINGQIPFYNVVAGGDPQVVTLDGPVIEQTASGVACRLIQAYFMSEKPDFEKCITMIDRLNQWQFRRNVPQEEIDNIDAQRTFISPPEWLSSLGFNDEYLALLPPGVSDVYGQTNQYQPQPYFEEWPQSTVQQPYPYLYKRRMPDLVNDTDPLPGFIRADVLREGALADLCNWPGTEAVKNPKYNPINANWHAKRFEDRVVDMIFRDEQVTQRTLKSFLGSTQWGYGPVSARWFQNHAPTELVSG